MNGEAEVSGRSLSEGVGEGLAKEREVAGAGMRTAEGAEVTEMGRWVTLPARVVPRHFLQLRTGASLFC